MRQVTNVFTDVIDGYNDINIDAEKANNGNFVINSLMKVHPGSTSYIYTDYGTKILYGIVDGKPVFTGFPSYLFLTINRRDRTVIPNDHLNASIRRLIQNVRNMNPVIYRTAEQTAQWAAFFRMVKE